MGWRLVRGRRLVAWGSNVEQLDAVLKRLRRAVPLAEMLETAKGEADVALSELIKGMDNKWPLEEF